jgi:hypothetical protein
MSSHLDQAACQVQPARTKGYANGAPRTTSPKLTRQRRQQTIRDGVTFAWASRSGDLITFHLGGEDMADPVNFKIKEPGITIQHPRGEFEYVSYSISAENAAQMSYRIAWVMSWLRRSGYRHIRWVQSLPTKSAGYGGVRRKKAKPARPEAS